MENLSKQINGNLLRLYDGNKNLVIDIFQKADAWVLWFIGFSIGGLALFAGNLDKFSHRLSSRQVHEIFIALFLSVISGVLFRYVYIWFYLHLIKNVFNRISSDFDQSNELPVYTPLVGNESFAELVLLIQSYTGENFNNLLPTYAEANEKLRLELCYTLIDHYTKAEKIYEQDKEKALKYVRDKLETYFARPFEDLKNKVKPSGKLFTFKFYMLIVFGSILFLSFIFSFGSALYNFCFHIQL